MKKIFLLLVLSLMLVGCTEITDDLKPKKPTAEFKITGETTQIFNTIEDLEDITFEIILKNFEENEILKEDIKIKWYMQEDISEYKELEDNIDMYDYLLIINRRTTLNIKAVISFKLNDKTETIDIVQPVQIVEKETHIALTNDFEGEKVNNIIKLKLGDLALNEIEFTATLVGNLTHKTGSFVVEKRNELNEVVKTESFIVENLDELVTDDKIVVKHTYLFNEIYTYVIYFEAGKYRSSDNYLDVNYGDFGITLLGEKVYNSNNIEDRVISFNLLDQDVIGKGQYVLYLNGQEIMRDNKLFTYTHTDKAVGGYLYHMEFIPTDKENPIQKTDKLLLVNGVVVNTEEEFVEAINNKVRGIILGSDIKYMSTNELVVDYPMTLFGDGKKISVMSTSIDIFLKVKSNDVNFSNIVFEKGKYQVMYEKTTNGYLEDMTFNLEQGRTSFDSIIKGDFDMDAGLYVDRSLVEVHNTTIVGGGIIGIRIEATEEVKSILTVTGTFDNIDYMNDGVEYRSIMQIGTGTSPEGSVIVAGQGFFDIAVPFSVSTDSKNLIKLWSNSEDRMRWILNSGAVKKQMIIGDSIDFDGVLLDLIISKDQTMMFNLGIVYTILDIVGPKGIYGIVEIENLDGSKIEGMKYLIKGHTSVSGPVEGYENGKDLLLYYNDSNELVRPLVPNKPGTYVVRLKIGESLELGTFEIVVK